ncbi:2,4-dienoyl-CoA reductase [Azoarcus sp. CIB]|uniref:SDR family oxidoreductase n=1 Tax=Aromatoleum sp. (strain CIB) TaxID=198107 RepID=UPI00067DCEE1|nr:SDR family oxidoreductase [Azoarcus sp. CIB]AKU12388.1 2,4-dienoyl-CoA reductase [Azoarcus sp. CIB]
MLLDDLMFKPGLMRGQRILVTGGGTGLGRVMAEAFLLLGSEVYLCGRRGAVVEQTAAELMAQHGGKVVGLACDIRQPEAIAAMLDSIWDGGGPLTGLINNAAGNFVSRTEDLSPRAFDAIANIVFHGSFYVTLECGKRWLAAGRRGNVLSMVVTWVWNGSAFTVPSAMSKAGLNAMTQSLAVEWGGRGIRINAIAPGVFPTESAAARLDPTGAAKPGDDVPMRRVGQMSELANLAVYLMAPGSDYINGETIVIDGGLYPATGGNFAKLTSLTDEDWRRTRQLIDERNAADKARRTI